jgi:hypothetical protein
MHGKDVYKTLKINNCKLSRWKHKQAKPYQKTINRIIEDLKEYGVTLTNDTAIITNTKPPEQGELL